MFLFHVTYRMTYLAAKLYHPLQAHKSVFFVSVVSRNSPHDLVNLISEEVVLLLRVKQVKANLDKETKIIKAWDCSEVLPSIRKDLTIHT